MTRAMTINRRGTLAADDQKLLPAFPVQGIIGVGLIEISQGIKITRSNIDERNCGRRAGRGREVRVALQTAPEEFRGRKEDLLQGEQGKAGAGAACLDVSLLQAAHPVRRHDWGHNGPGMTQIFDETTVI
jgi:hypothetical protein